jgi:hypothetical protein
MKTYTFDYDFGQAEARFEVNPDKFTAENALETLNFFHWDWDQDEDPIDEVMKKYAMEVIWIATSENKNTKGVIDAFMRKEGYCKIDRSSGIELISVSEYEFNPDSLEMTVSS